MPRIPIHSKSQSSSNVEINIVHNFGRLWSCGQPNSHILGSSLLILVGVGLDFLYQRRGGGVWILFQMLNEGLNFFCASLANIFNKCHEKGFFIKKHNWIWVYKIWARATMVIFLKCSSGVVFFCERRGLNFVGNCQPYFSALPLPVLSNRLC